MVRGRTPQRAAAASSPMARMYSGKLMRAVVMGGQYHASCTRQAHTVLPQHKSRRDELTQFVFNSPMEDRKKLIGKRLRQTRNTLGLTQGEVAARAKGITQSRLSNWEQGTRQPGVDEVISVSSILKVSPAWLLGIDDEHTSPVAEPPADYILVPRYNITAGLGDGELFRSEQVIDELAFRTVWLRDKGLQPDQIAVIACRGDSMTPTIRDGDIALVDLRSRDLQRDGIYAIRRDRNGGDSEIVVKRLQTTMAGAVRIISDNDEYPPEEYPAGQVPEIAVVGRIVWAGGDVK